MSVIRAIYYVNQFFAGIGGEDKADVALGFSEKPLGPARRFQELSNGSFEIVRTAFCGDNYFADHEAAVLASVLEVVKEHEINFLIAGPAIRLGSDTVLLARNYATS